MSKPVVALLAGLAVVAAAGRARRGSFASGSTRADQEVEELKKKIAKYKAIYESERDEDLLEAIDSMERKLSSLLPLTTKRHAEQKDRGEQDFKKSIRSAEKFLEFLRAEKGALHNVRVWSKEGVGVRVYFPNSQYLTFNGFELNQAFKGRTHFDWGGFYFSQRKAIALAIRKYEDWAAAEFEKELKEYNERFDEELKASGSQSRWRGSRAHRFGTYTMGLTPQRVDRELVPVANRRAGRHGRMVNLPLGFTLKMPQADERAKRGSSSRAQQIDLTLVKDWPYALLLSLLEEKARLDARMTGMFPDQDYEIGQSVEAVEREIENYPYDYGASDAWTARWEDGRLTREIEVVLRMDLTPLETRELLRQRRGAR
jgi:hypothetical protein